MKQIIKSVFEEYAQSERNYELDELIESIENAILNAYEVKKRSRSYSQFVKQKAVRDDLFHGDTFVPERDEKRLTGQLERVYSTMKDGCWYTLGEIKELIGKGTESAISARIRDFKKMGIMYEKRHLRNGLWQYRLLI